MTELDPRLTHTSLRARYERARELSPEAQLEDCVDYLQNPEILIFEFLDAFFAVEIASQSDSRSAWTRPMPEDHGDEIVLEYFPRDLEVAVQGDDRYSFKCMASGVDPVPPSPSAADSERGGLDYVGLIHPPRDGVVLGVVCSASERTAYILFLRLLTCLSEIAPPSQMERLRSEILGGRPDPKPVLDLHLVLSSASEDGASASLAQFTHDLADVVKRELDQAWQFPDVLRSIDCLRMDPDDFDGRLKLDWRV